MEQKKKKASNVLLAHTVLAPSANCDPRVSRVLCARAPQAMRMRKAGSNLHPTPAAHVWGHLTLITPDRDDCNVALSR